MAHQITQGVALLPNATLQSLGYIGTSKITINHDVNSYTVPAMHTYMDAKILMKITTGSNMHMR